MKIIALRIKQRSSQQSTAFRPTGNPQLDEVGYARKGRRRPFSRERIELCLP
jgi:hypothetical protein